MRTPVTPRTAERTFTQDELFFSTTDPKGIILSGNDVFARVSGHSRQALLGSPHNIIRHPDMPRAVFKLLWDYLAEGRSFAGYVKNLAADGSYYWVMALVVPITGGFLSIRFKPSSAYFPIVQKVYADLLAIERKADTGGGSRRDGMRLAGVALTGAIKASGFVDYDEFMHAALATELALHDAAVRARRSGGSVRDADPILATCERAEQALRDAFAHVDRVVATTKEFEKTSKFLSSLSSNVHRVSMNALIASCRLRNGGGGLSIVTQNLAESAKDSTGTINEMSGRLLALTSSLRDAAFGITAARLQVEMTGFFLREVIAKGDAGPAGETSADIRMLSDALHRSAGHFAAALPRARAPLGEVARLHGDLERSLRRLASVQLIGRVQATGLDDDGHFHELIGQIDRQLEHAGSELDTLAGGLKELGAVRLGLLERHARDVVGRVTAFRSAAA